MKAHDDAHRLDRIAKALGLSQEALSTAAPISRATGSLVIDGAPDQFDRWADNVTDPERRRRLTSIADILQASKDKRGTP